MGWSEFEIIRDCFERGPSRADVLLGIGDDAALVDASGPLAVTTDTLVADVHFPSSIAADALGYRSLAVNLSDLAAMGAEPRWCTLALTVPAADQHWLTAFAGGLLELAEQHTVALIGGDLTRGPLTVTVQLIGAVGAGEALRRSGGHAGDDVYVTGSLGDAAAGLALLGEAAEEADTAADEPARHALRQRFLRPTARVAEGRALVSVANSAIDVSDGLLADLGHLCESAGLGAVIDVERLPLSAELLALFPPQGAQAYALAGGDDYELCFTAPPAKAQAVEAAMEALGTGVRRIGRLEAGNGVVCRRDGQVFTPSAQGYRHF